MTRAITAEHVEMSLFLAPWLPLLVLAALPVLLALPVLVLVERARVRRLHNFFRNSNRRASELAPLSPKGCSRDAAQP